MIALFVLFAGLVTVARGQTEEVSCVTIAGNPQHASFHNRPNCDQGACRFSLDPSVHYKFTNDFNATERADIEEGAAAWNASSNANTRGIQWEYIRDPGFAWLINFMDDKSTVLKKDRQWFVNHNFPGFGANDNGTVAYTVRAYRSASTSFRPCEFKGGEIVVLSDPHNLNLLNNAAPPDIVPGAYTSADELDATDGD